MCFLKGKFFGLLGGILWGVGGEGRVVLGGAFVCVWVYVCVCVCEYVCVYTSGYVCVYRNVFFIRY